MATSPTWQLLVFRTAPLWYRTIAILILTITITSSSPIAASSDGYDADAYAAAVASAAYDPYHAPTAAQLPIMASNLHVLCIFRDDDYCYIANNNTVYVIPACLLIARDDRNVHPYMYIIVSVQVANKCGQVSPSQ